MCARQRNTPQRLKIAHRSVEKALLDLCTENFRFDLQYFNFSQDGPVLLSNFRTSRGYWDILKLKRKEQMQKNVA
jgi:hypothetical protein